MKNPDLYFVGCSSHMAHNAACKGEDSFSGAFGFDVEDLVVDLYYWFDKCTKCKNELNVFCVFYDTIYKQVLKHVSTHWFSCGKTISRTLEIYQPLKSFFFVKLRKAAKGKRLTVTKQNSSAESLYCLQLLGCFALQTPCSHSETSKTLDSTAKLCDKVRQ